MKDTLYRLKESIAIAWKVFRYLAFGGGYTVEATFGVDDGQRINMAVVVARNEEAHDLHQWTIQWAERENASVLRTESASLAKRNKNQ